MDCYIHKLQHSKAPSLDMIKLIMKIELSHLLIKQLDLQY